MDETDAKDVWVLDLRADQQDEHQDQDDAPGQSEGAGASPAALSLLVLPVQVQVPGPVRQRDPQEDAGANSDASLPRVASRLRTHLHQQEQ